MVKNGVPKPFYAEELRQWLMEKYGIPTELREQVIAHLEGSAEIWWRRLTSKELIEREKQARAAWRELHKLSKKLADAIDGLPNKVLDRFEVHSSTDSMQSITAKGDETERGLLIYRSEDGMSSVIMGPEDMFRGVRYIRDRAEEEIANFGALPRGQKSDDALSLWMSNMEILWTRILERPFTRDVTPDGEPITPAAEFVVDAFSVLDPEAPSRKVLNQMRNTISRSRKAAARRLPAK